MDSPVGIIGNPLTGVQKVLQQKYSEEEYPEVVYEGTYIPNGNSCSLKVEYNTRTLEIVSHKWDFDDVSLKKEGSVPGQVQKIFNSLRLRKSKEVDINMEIVFHMIHSPDRAEILDKKSPEDYLYEFLYIYQVTRLQDDDEPFYLPTERWTECSYHSHDTIKILVGPVVYTRKVYIGQVTEEFLKDILQSPFENVLRRQRAMYDVAKQAGHLMANKMIYKPINPFQFQRPEYWVEIQK